MDDWQTDAACRGMDTATFFPARGEPLGKVRAICAQCPVTEPCLAHGLGPPAERYGIWGGRSERERRHLRRDTKTT